jgi:predicted nucleic acid-binding protein
MKRLFVDTGGWVACAVENDIHNTRAIAARDAWLARGGELLTTDYVVDETLTHLRARFGLAVAQAWWEHIGSSPRIRWEWIGPVRAEKARELFFRYHDKSYSFTDCTSFVVMKELKLKDALTTDVHFAQMGFQVHPTLSKAAK